MTVTALRIEGLDCVEEVKILKRELSPLKGIQELAFDVLNAKMVVTHESALISTDEIIRTVNATGMRAEVFTKGLRQSTDTTAWMRWGKTALTGLSGIALALGFLVHASQSGLWTALGSEAVPVPTLAKIIYCISAITGAWFVFPKALLALQRLRPDMNLLMTVAVLGALLIGEWFEAATVAFLFAVSLALEAWSVSRARNAISALMALSPPMATVLESGGKEKTVDVSEVEVGTVIIVKPGERIPLDGKILRGSSSINQAPITGESLPVEKIEGDDVFAGTINQDGALEITVTKLSEQSTLSTIAKLVEDAQAKRSPSEQWVETFARYYTPAVLALAIIVGIIPPIFDGLWSKWFYEALVLLVIACPCALVISTPVSIVAALTAAAKNGVLIKGGLHIETPSRLKVIALDKTGTLTRGILIVQKIVPLSGHSETELLSIAASIESRSEHPIAKAIVVHAQSKNIKFAPVHDYQALKGKGASALLAGRKVWIGSHRYLEERGEETPEMHTQLETLSSGGQSIVVVGENGHVCGFIALSDEIREESREVIQKLKASGIEHVIMLTGDNKPTGMAVGNALGLDEVRAELLPEDKIKAIEDLVTQYHHVAMVGDGVNDAPALARASLGIAMGTAGSDAALETADIALMRDDLRALPWLIEHSKQTLTIIRQNIFASLGIKAIFVVLTLLGHASLWAAIAADMGVSLAVVSNALRLTRDNSSKAFLQ